MYDQFEDRFLVVALEQTQTVFGAPEDASRILVAVSKDHNPNTPTAADWNFLAIDSKTFLFGPFFVWADYPGFEVDEEAVYVTANMFTLFSSPVPGAFGGVRLWIIDKGKDGGFYDGGPATVTQHNPYANAGIATTTMPA
ncbi:MAG: hemolysin, partial [Calditrichaeota bacterium]